MDGFIKKMMDLDLETGASYNLVVWNTSQIINSKLYTVTRPNAVSMMWLFPQYFVMSMAEVMLELPLTTYAYEEVCT